MTEGEAKTILSLSQEIMLLANNTLVVNLRFLDAAMSRLVLMPTDKMEGLSTDGHFLYYNPQGILKNYKAEKELVVRNYLHSLLHCIFRHHIITRLVNPNAWNLACDIAVEVIIDELKLSQLKVYRESYQESVVSNLQSKIKYLTAEKIYDYLISNATEEDFAQWARYFKGDDHSIWYSQQNAENVDGNDDSKNSESQSNKKSSPQNEKKSSEKKGENLSGENSEKKNSEDQKSSGENLEQENSSDKKSSGSLQSLQEQMEDWKNIAEKMQMDLETFSKERGDAAGNLMQNLKAATREKYDYTAFLKRFAVMGEAMKINDDEFDYIYYTYGLNLYGNVPMVEPLEYKDIKKVKEFVIAIDTSASCRGKIVRNFLNKTYSILKGSENFFTRIHVHIVQCDHEVQSDTVITCEEDFDEFIKNGKLSGFGATDFRPVFDYVNQLILDDTFENLKGLIYFTDGYGVYPEQMPEYDVIFAFLNEDERRPKLPVWAIQVVLEEEELEEDETDKETGEEAEIEAE